MDTGALLSLWKTDEISACDEGWSSPVRSLRRAVVLSNPPKMRSSVSSNAGELSSGTNRRARSATKSD
jgi:hypothetical protein